LFVEGNTSGDIKIAFQNGATAFAAATWGFSGDRGNTAHHVTTITTAELWSLATGDLQTIDVFFCGTAGGGGFATLDIQAAQNASNVDPTNVFNLSHVVGWKL